MLVAMTTYHWRLIGEGPLCFIPPSMSVDGSMALLRGFQEYIRSPISDPAVRDFLDGLAVLIAQRILTGGQGIGCTVKHQRGDPTC